MTLLRLIKHLTKRFCLGVSILMLLFVICIPLFYLGHVVTYAFLDWRHVLLSILGCVLIGHFFTYYRLPLLSGVSRAFLSFLAVVYGHFLEQAAKYFCDDNTTNPFREVVAIRLSDGVEVLGFSTNADSVNRVVFVPTSPNPTSGIILRIHEHHIRQTAMDREEFLRYTLTSGAYNMNDSGMETNQSRGS